MGITIEDLCVGCPQGCIGCGRKHVKALVCDGCGEQLDGSDTVFEDGAEYYCADCYAKEYGRRAEDILSEE